MEGIIGFLQNENIRFRTQVSLASCTTFRIGGPADLCIYPSSLEQAAALVRFFKKLECTYFIIGKGSNLLMPDEGVRTPLVFTESMDFLSFSEGGIQAGAGVSLARLSNFAAEHGIGGLEFLHGIPGSVGGGVFMNAGAYGGEISQVLQESVSVNRNGEKQVRTLAEHAFSYRHSSVAPGEILCSALFTGVSDTPEQIREHIAEFDRRRRAKQPLEYPSAGSTFKRPKGYFAGQLIEKCGLKGFRVGDAQVSEKHAGFLINRGHATYAEMTELISLVQNRVLSQFGVYLEPEVKILK